jgi:NADH-quinone oxidoreductase subunit G
MGMTRVGDDTGQGGLEGIASHEGVVLVLGDPLEDQDPTFGADAHLYVYLGTHPVTATHSAHFLLPQSTFAEREGTFVNHEGRVQRFWPALQAPGAARPAWLVLETLLGELTGGAAPARAEEAFQRLAERQAAFAGLTYPDLGTTGALVNEPARLVGD